MSSGLGSPTHVEAIAAALERRVAKINTWLPGRVTRVDADGACVDVEPLLLEAGVNALGEDVMVKLPIAPSVPVFWPGASGFVQTCPVEVGDTGILLTCEGALGRWLTLGGVVDPEDKRRHYYGSGAVFLPGLRPNTSKRAAPPSGAAFGADGGLQVVVTESAVELGGTLATQAAVNGTAYRSAEDTMLGLLSAALAAIASAYTALGDTATAGTVTAAITGITAFQAGAAGYLSTVVKVKP